MRRSKRNEGVNKLALYTGLIGVVSGLIYIIFSSAVWHFSTTPLRVWSVVIGALVLGFIVPFGLVLGITWVIKGFKKSSERKW